MYTKTIKSKFNDMERFLFEEHQGSVTFEFVIIMTIFAGLIFGVSSSPLMDAIKAKIGEVTAYITNSNNSSNNLWPR